MSSDYSDVEQSLKKFILVMNAWELRYYKEVREKGLVAVREKMKEDLNEIFCSFCTKRDRKQGRQTSLLCCDPPEYSPSEIFISSTVSGKKASISTQQTVGFKNKYRYTFKSTDSRWLLDKKECLDDDDGNERWRQVSI